jgi:hypothetical protein
LLADAKLTGFADGRAGVASEEQGDAMRLGSKAALAVGSVALTAALGGLAGLSPSAAGAAPVAPAAAAAVRPVPFAAGNA